MKKILIVIFCILFACSITAQTTDWVKSFGGPDSDKGISIGTDSLGYIYVSGWFNDEATFGGITLQNNPVSTWGNNKENFVFKMDSLGNVLWAVAGGNLSGGCCDDRALGMHVTPGGDVFITGTFWSSYYLGSCTVTQNQWGTALNSSDNSLLAKLDKDGNCVWAIGFGADEGSGSGPDCPYPIYDADDHSYDVEVDKDGFIYVTGFFSGVSADFDNFTITNPDWGVDCQPMGYVGKLDQNGNWLWVDKFDGIKDQRGSRDNRLAIDNFSNIYVVGGFQNTGNYGPYQIISNGEWDAFIFKIDKDGNWQWAEGIGSNKTDRANGVAIDVCNDIYITGEYRNPMVFPGANASNGSDTLSHKQKRDVFIAKMNSNGDWKWAKRARTSGTDKPYQMSVDANKQVFLGGVMKGEATFNDNLVIQPPIAGDTSASAWVAQLDGSTSTGDWVWAKMAGTDTDDDDRTGDICPDGFGNVYAVGFFEDIAVFDGDTLDASGRKKDVFVWKMSMTPGSFTYNNSYDTIISRDSLVFNALDTGLLLQSSSFMVDGCDTLFADTMINFQLGARIYFKVNILGTNSALLVDGIVMNMPLDSNDYYIDDVVNISSIIDPDYEFVNWSSQNHLFSPNANNLAASFSVNSFDTIVLNVVKKPTITYVVEPPATSTTITANGNIINAFPASVIYPTDQNVNLSTNIDPLYGFETWHADSVTFTPSALSEDPSFIASNNATVTLHLYKKPTITYNVDPPGTNTSININGNIVSAFPYSETVYRDELNNISPSIDPDYVFSSWTSDSNTLLDGAAMINSFYGEYNDYIVLNIGQMGAFISGDVDVCTNAEKDAEVKVSFRNAVPPYNFVYAIDGVNQGTITTEENPYYIKTRTPGIYTLTYFSDASTSSSGMIDGSAKVEVMDAPIASFLTDADTISTINANIKLQDISTGNITAWQWDFGDGNMSSQPHPYHSYDGTLGVYQINLVITDDMGCSDTVAKQIWISDEYWMYLPNSFTPNNDNNNDVFCIQYNGIREETFFFNIYDKLSNLVFSTTDISELKCLLDSGDNGWDGTHYETGEELSVGSYVYQIYYQDHEGWKHQDFGQLFIIR